MYIDSDKLLLLLTALQTSHFLKYFNHTTLIHYILYLVPYSCKLCTFPLSSDRFITIHIIQHVSFQTPSLPPPSPAPPPTHTLP